MKRYIYFALLLAAGGAFSPRAGAQSAYLYSLNPSGNVSVNGNKINSLPGDFDPDTPTDDLDDAWRDLAVVGGNVYALRGNGYFVLNGEKQWTLPFDSRVPWYWTELIVADGTVYALRQDGKVAVNASIAAELPRNDFFYTALQVVTGATYALRSDGAVFKNNASTPLFTFQGGPGLNGSQDGRAVDTLWVALKVNPTGDYLYALRSDGQIFRGQLPAGDSAGQLVDGLPFPSQIVDFTFGDLYTDFEFDDVTGLWVALRANGKVYRDPAPLAETDDFPGSGSTDDNSFFDLAVYGGQYFVVRGDGQVYVEGNPNLLLQLGGRNYGRIELTPDAPVLAGQKNNAPAVVQYTLTTNAGGLPVTIPVIATDVETPTAELLITPVSLPTGAVWNATEHVLTWTTPAEKGSATFSYIVDDGSGSAKTYSSKIKIKEPDLDPAKNKGPFVPKLKGAVALVGEEYRLFLPLGDPDNDPVSVTVDPLAYPFNAGAVYLPATSEFVWTPTNADLGKQTIEFTLADGLTTSTLKLKLEVKSPLFIPPLPD
ncbi:MAG: hypothetical protein PCFJNLEI_02572 [Verrucomicrobiae bacterium]|nr:hypothetical protein [Verrucomicrobiae bacterium]